MDIAELSELSKRLRSSFSHLHLYKNRLKEIPLYKFKQQKGVEPMKLNILIVATATALLTGCAASPISGVFSHSDWDGNVVDNTIEPLKTGKSCSKSILGIFAFGDASLSGAMKDGDISKVAYFDHQSTNIAYFYGQYCTIVKGQ